MDNNTETVKPLTFIARFVGAFGQFFKYMGDGQYAARCQRLQAGELVASETAPKVVTETVEVIREIPAPTLDSVAVDGAYQLLQLMQHEARFVDFLQENIDQYSDAEVGAASRQIHKGCQKVLEQNFVIKPVHQGEENSRIEVPADYDNKQIQLEGQVSGSGPYAGTLIHPGWQVVEANLPKVASLDGLHIIAPAQVEV
ncbi:DUF2760 domain-containing protein [Marinomonas epiphytica]